MSFFWQKMECQRNGACSLVHCIQKTMYTIRLDFEKGSSNSLHCLRKTSNLNISVTVRALQAKSMQRARYESWLSRGPIISVRIWTNRTFLVRIRTNQTVFKWWAAGIIVLHITLQNQCAKAGESLVRKECN